MAQQYDNTNSGALFKNKKRQSEKSPDYTGQAEIVDPNTGEVIRYWVSAWIRTPRNGGDKFMAMAFTRKEESPLRNPAPAGASPSDDFDDDIPF